jgi:hypothetical protein
MNSLGLLQGLQMCLKTAAVRPFLVVEWWSGWVSSDIGLGGGGVVSSFLDGQSPLVGGRPAFFSFFLWWRRERLKKKKPEHCVYHTFDAHLQNSFDRVRNDGAANVMLHRRIMLNSNRYSFCWYSAVVFFLVFLGGVGVGVGFSKKKQINYKDTRRLHTYIREFSSVCRPESTLATQRPRPLELCSDTFVPAGRPTIAFHL